MNLNFKNARNHVSQKTPPIWFMRQAGRYHKHYQGMRLKHDFKSLCVQPELATEVAMGPIRDFDFDVAILFSDLLFPLEGLGFGLNYGDKGPELTKDLLFAKKLSSKDIPKAIEYLDFQAKALRLTREALPKNKSLIGFVGGPWTLFVYASEGHHAGGLKKAKSDFFIFKDFFILLKNLMKENIRMQLAAGAEVVMIFDTAAGELNPVFYKQEIEPALIELATEFPYRVGYYSKNTYPEFLSPEMRAAHWAGFGFDHRVDLTQEFKKFNGGFLQGNFDQNLLFLPGAVFEKELYRYLAPLKELSSEQRSGWVCGLGHGVLPMTPEDNVKAFVDIVRRELS
jgi:uroporphyrinogen decarboxylase